MSYEELLNKLDSLDKKSLEELIFKVKDWAILHGVGMRSKVYYDNSGITVAPFTLFPSPFSRRDLSKVTSIQTVLNSLIHKLAYDHQFLEDSLSKVIEYDEFTRKLFDIYTTVKKEGYVQTICCGLLRMDYLGDSDEKLKLVEMNTMASSMAGLIESIVNTFRFVFKELDLIDHLARIPDNNALSLLSGGLVKAWEIYNVDSAVILFVVEEVTYNICDQRFLEFEAKRLNNNVKTLRRSFKQLISEAHLSEDRRLFVGDVEVGVVYFRYGYVPEHYTDAGAWEMRLLLERSKAIKCPSVQYHLVGTKKVQQVLCAPGVLEKYIDDKESLNLIRELFVEIYPLDMSVEGEKGYQLALSSPEKYVLKPQREGGGNNIYGNDIPAFLKGLTRAEASAYILMRLIESQPTRNILVSPNGFTDTTIISEIGIYGVIIGNEKEIFLNESGGHMVRAKDAESLEGGVIAGQGFLTSPYVV